jgi:hypothetical protein
MASTLARSRCAGWEALNSVRFASTRDRGGESRSTVHACNKNLHRLMNEIEEWELTRREETAPAVGA